MGEKEVSQGVNFEPIDCPKCGQRMMPEITPIPPKVDLMLTFTLKFKETKPKEEQLVVKSESYIIISYKCPCGYKGAPFILSENDPDY